MLFLVAFVIGSTKVVERDCVKTEMSEAQSRERGQVRPKLMADLFRAVRLYPYEGPYHLDAWVPDERGFVAITNTLSAHRPDGFVIHFVNVRVDEDDLKSDYLVEQRLKAKYDAAGERIRKQVAYLVANHIRGM